MGPLIGYVPGVFDLFHVGHLNVLRQARELCDVLVAGVVSDEVCEAVKGMRPFVPLEERIAIVDAIGIVDATYAELTTDKLDAWRGGRLPPALQGRRLEGHAEGAARSSGVWPPSASRSSTSPTPCTPRAPSSAA